MQLNQLAGFLQTMAPLMRALQVSEPQHRTVAHGDDAESVLLQVQELAFRPTTEIHFATVTVKGQRVVILALQEPAALPGTPA